MNDPIPTIDYINIGLFAAKLCDPFGCDSGEYANVVEHLVILLHNCRFPASLRIVESFDHNALRHFVGRIAGGTAKQFETISALLVNTLRDESLEKETRVLNRADVSLRLTDVPRLLPHGRKLTLAQKTLLNETTLCLECGAYRAAAVMGWNLAYDYIRQWAFDKQLTAFNQGLAKECPEQESDCGL